MIPRSATSLLILVLVMSWSTAQSQVDTSAKPQPGLVQAQERWQQLDPEQRKAVMATYSAFKKISPEKRAELILRIRELDPSRSSTLVRQVESFLNSSIDVQKKLRRRGIAYRLWRWKLTEEEREHFRELAPKERHKFLRSAIQKKEAELLGNLPEKERDRLLKMSNVKRWEALNPNQNRKRSPDSPRIQRVLHLAHGLKRADRRHFIENGSVPEDRPRLKKAVESLSPEEKEWITKYLRRGLHRNGSPKEPGERHNRRGRPFDGTPPGTRPELENGPDQDRHRQKPPRRRRDAPGLRKTERQAQSLPDTQQTEQPDKPGKMPSPGDLQIIDHFA